MLCTAPCRAESMVPLGVYMGPGCFGAARVADYETWLGRRPERASGRAGRLLF